MEFGGRLMELRKSRGWSQEQLGEAIGVTRQTVSKWETGETTPEMGKLVQLADLFGLTLDQMVRPAAGPQEAWAGGEDRRRSAWEYEYKSKRTLFGLPLVHIHTRRRGWGPPCRAKGILAIGDVALGAVALGGIAFGGIALGGLGVGLFALGGLALGLVLALGGVGVGILAVGGCAVGVVAIGGLALGAYSMGGAAIATRVAAGGFAQGYIAIGERAVGTICFLEGQAVAPGAIQAAILRAFPDTWPFLAALFGAVL